MNPFGLRKKTASGKLIRGNSEPTGGASAQSIDLTQNLADALQNTIQDEPEFIDPEAFQGRDSVDITVDNPRYTRQNGSEFKLLDEELSDETEIDENSETPSSPKPNSPNETIRKVSSWEDGIIDKHIAHKKSRMKSGAYKQRKNDTQMTEWERELMERNSQYEEDQDLSGIMRNSKEMIGDRLKSELRLELRKDLIYSNDMAKLQLEEKFNCLHVDMNEKLEEKFNHLQGDLNFKLNNFEERFKNSFRTLSKELASQIRDTMGNLSRIGSAVEQREYNQTRDNHSDKTAGVKDYSRTIEDGDTPRDGPSIIDQGSQNSKDGNSTRRPIYEVNDTEYDQKWPKTG